MFRAAFLHRRKILGIAVLFAGVVSTLSAHAEDVKPSDLRGKAGKEPVSVLQNRFFLKAHRPELGLLVGSYLNEAYTKTTTMGVRTALFFNEWVGAEVQYLKTSISDTDDRKALNDLKYRDLDEEKEVSPDPEVNPIYHVTDVNVIIAPFYGKLNLLNQYIVYSDLYATAGYAKVDTRQGSLNAMVVGFGQRFYMMDALSVRLDFRDHIYTEQRNGSNSRKNALSVDLGMSYFFL